MKLVARFWSTFTHFLHTLTFSPFEESGFGLQQQPLFSENHHHAASSPVPTYAHVAPVDVWKKKKPGPIFRPPGRDLKDDGSGFTCDYSAMEGWTACSTPSDRGCWLQNPTGANFTINTDYEADVPLGIVRPYKLIIGPNSTINVDGQVFPAAKVINNTYPGPWIQACWGDTVQVTVTVTNDAQFLNGTALHWHGIRQWLTMHMDGVPGVSQCPIAPGSTFVYEWRARQYGSSWYHSHYTLQYADGVLGALTIHGPSTAPYDEAGAPPLLLSDWDHTTAFQLSYGAPSNNPTILLSGVGDVQKTYNVTNKGGPKITTLNFTAGKRYLLRIINTSLGSSFLFTIDNHLLQVVTSDFVPIQPYKSDSILVAIGQRYNVIVEAKPSTNPSGSPYPNPIPSDLNFWIRVYSIESEIFNTSLANANYNELGIIRYNNASINQPSSRPWNYSYQATNYYDETQLVPWVPWFIGNQSNAPGNTPEEHDVAIIPAASRTQYPLAVFAVATPTPSPTPVQLVPFRIDWTNPMFQNLDMKSGWPDPWVVVAENGTPDDWVYLLFENERLINHPLHLHGHDFAILSQSDQPYNSKVILKTFNPPRRDVVTLPAGGHVVIAFRTDNPGAWLMHCHIAFHASSGLALQVLENRQEAARIWPTGNSHALNVSQQLCDEWKAWVTVVNQPINPWFQDDSGI